MEEKIETKVSPDLVWRAWEKVHELHGQTGIEKGQKGKNRFRYEVLEVIKGERFSILWKTLFVHLIFTHSVAPSFKGSIITYQVTIKGLFALPARWLLGAKIRQNLRTVLESIVRQLESDRTK